MLTLSWPWRSWFRAKLQHSRSQPVCVVGSFVAGTESSHPAAAGISSLSSVRLFLSELDCSSTAFQVLLNKMHTMPLVMSGLLWNVKGYHSLNSHSSGVADQGFVSAGQDIEGGVEERGQAPDVSDLSLPWEAVELVLEHAFHGQSWWLWMECCPVSEPGGEGSE